MKKINLVYIFLILFLIDCNANKISEFVMKLNESEKRGEISIEEKRIFISRYNDGRIAYGTNCAGCHTVNGSRKNSVPKFTKQQLELYTLRTKNKQHSDKLRTENLSEEDLLKIFYFLHNQSGN